MSDSEENIPLLKKKTPNSSKQFAFLLSLSAFIVFGFGWYCYLEDSRQSIIRLFLPIFLWGFCLVLLLVVYKERKLSSIILQNQPAIKNGNDLPTKWDLYDDTEFIVLYWCYTHWNKTYCISLSCIQFSVTRINGFNTRINSCGVRGVPLKFVWE